MNLDKIRLEGKYPARNIVLKGLENPMELNTRLGSAVRKRLIAGLLAASVGVSVGLCVNAAGTDIVSFPLHEIQVDQFGTLDPATTDAAAIANAAKIQAALTAATSNVLAQKAVRLPPGVWYTDRIQMPVGVTLSGTSSIETTAKSGTRLVQIGTGDDVIRFNGQVDPSSGNSYWYGVLQHFTIFGQTTAPDGYAINFYESNKTTTVAPQDTCCIRNICIRRMKQGGMNMPRGGLPFTFSDIKFLFNNGPGITFDSFFNHQGCHFLNISGDGNNGGIFHFKNLANTGNILITNLKSEQRINLDYGNVEMQQNAIVIESTAADVPISIVGATHVCSVPDGGGFIKKPGNFIYHMDSDCPHLEWQNVGIRVRPTDTGPDPYVVYAPNIATYPVAIPYTVSTGRLSNQVRLDRVATIGRRLFGRMDTYVSNLATPDVDDQISGLSPMRSEIEMDADANKKHWARGPSGGNYLHRAIADDGTATTFRTEQRDTANPGKVRSIQDHVPTKHGSFTVAELQANVFPCHAASNPNYFVVVSDGAGGKRLAQSLDHVVPGTWAWHYVDGLAAV